MKKLIKNNSGFTLVEIVVVIVILTILLTISFISLTDNLVGSRNTQRKSDI
jgi:prepilin-type N-terminal cleavage/methylation domain-containing protein